jgi:purine-binding chemotaxis protein CheW
MSTLYATFLVAGHYLGIDVLEMQEVLRGQRLTPVPLAPEAVEGLINLRGQIVPAIDLRRVLKLAPAEPGQDRFNVVARGHQGPVSLQVDEIGDVVELDTAGCELPPDNVDPAIGCLLRGVYRLKDRLLLVLDTARATEIVPAATGAANRSQNDAKTE